MANAANPVQFGSKPTATQAENDAAAIGASVLNKAADGSPQTGPSGQIGPSITSLSPSTAVAPTVALTVNGARFTTASKIWFGGTQQATTFVSATQLTASISGGTAGAKSVFVKDGVLNSNSLTFTFT